MERRTKAPLTQLGVAGCNYRHIKVHLVGESGNAMYILGKVQKALKDNGASQKVRDAFIEEATAGDYNHLLSTVQQWVTVPGHSESDCNCETEDEPDLEDEIAKLQAENEKLRNQLRELKG